MLSVTTISEEIIELKQRRHAILLAHHYQGPEIQELADVVGDSLELARRAREFSGDVIAFCGVWFMAETAKVLNPERTVVVPDREAGCSLWTVARSSRSAISGETIPTTSLSATSIRRSK